jgi:hypothetical protein
MIRIAAAFALAALLSSACLWAVRRWSGAPARRADLLIIAALCTGIALLPSVYALLLAAIFLALLTTRVLDADTLEAVLMVTPGRSSPGSS